MELLVDAHNWGKKFVSISRSTWPPGVARAEPRAADICEENEARNQHAPFTAAQQELKPSLKRRPADWCRSIQR